MAATGFYDAHDSAVGPVFDVATFSRKAQWVLAISSATFGLLVCTALILAWKPTLLIAQPPELVETFHTAVMEQMRNRAWLVLFGTGVAVVVAWFAFAGAIAGLVAAVSEDKYYLRIGPGGLSVRVPERVDFGKLGLAFKELHRDIPAEEITSWKVIQKVHEHMPTGATTKGMAFLEIRTVDGGKFDICLSQFNESADLIHSRLASTVQLTGQMSHGASHPVATNGATSPVHSLEKKCEIILDTLAELLEHPQATTVVLSDGSSDRFVQFARSQQALLCDLPRQALDDAQADRASRYFERLRREFGEEEDSVTVAGLVANPTGASYQAEVRDPQQAARIALDVFRDVYQLPDGFPLVVSQG